MDVCLQSCGFMHWSRNCYRQRRVRPVCILLGLCACAPRTLPLSPHGPPLRPPGHQGVLEVSISLSSGVDPLAVDGESLSLTGVADALADYVAVAGEPWAERNQGQRPGGWQLQIDVLRATARAEDDRLTVELEAQVTLRALSGRRHLAQTRAYCHRTEALDPDPRAAVHHCMQRLAHDVSGWLDGTSP